MIKESGLKITFFLFFIKNWHSTIDIAKKSDIL